MAKKTKSSSFEDIIVNGCLIEADTVYEIVPRNPVGSVPSEYKQMGSSKERVPGITNTVTLSPFTTGFFANSDIFNRDILIKSDWDKRAAKAEKLYNTFAEPMRMYISDIERIKFPSDDEFFDKYNSDFTNRYLMADIGEGVKFDTSNPIQRFKLYIAIVEDQLVMKGRRTEEEKQLGLRDEGDVSFAEAQYAYVSVKEKKNKIQSKAISKMESSFRFATMAKEDKDLLIKILNYISIPTPPTSTTADLYVLYENVIEGNVDKQSAFVNILSRYDENPSNFDRELELLSKLNSRKGSSILTDVNGVLYLGETPLGANLKSAAQKLIEDPTLMEIFITRYEE